MNEKMAATRERILQAASELLAEGGTEAVSTRAVSARAGVQQPTLYRLFGDKRGLLDALATYGFERYMASKQTAHRRRGTALDQLRRGWDNHIGFGLEQPAVYMLMYGSVHTVQPSAAAKESYQQLLAFMEKVAATGVLRVPPDVASHMIQSAAVGVTLRLIAMPDDPSLADLSPRVRDAILDAILVDAKPDPARSANDTVAALALSLSAVLAEGSPVFTDAETSLLREWLRRLATSHPGH